MRRSNRITISSIRDISSIVIPLFPRVVFDGNICRNHLTCGISSIILWFVIKIFPRIFSTICKLYVWCEVYGTTLTLYATTISISYVRTLKNLNSLVCDTSRTVCNWISSCRYTTNTLCKCDVWC